MIRLLILAAILVFILVVCYSMFKANRKKSIGNKHDLV